MNPVAYAIDLFRGTLTGTTLLAPSVETGMAIVAGMVAGVGLLSVLLFRRMMVRLERTGSLALF